MNELITLLKDGRSRTIEMIAMELNRPVENVKRDIEFLEHVGEIKRVEFSKPGEHHSCDGCTGCSAFGCSGCWTCG